MVAIMTALGLVFGFFAYMVLTTLLAGVVLVDLWVWFVMPIFHVGALNIPQALGISLLVGFMTHQISNSKQTEKTATIFVTGAMRPLILWGIGWVIMKFL